jgi:amino acid permease
MNNLSQFIVISSVIGAGVFNNGGSAIKVAGPAGALVALLVMCGWPVMMFYTRQLIVS